MLTVLESESEAHLPRVLVSQEVSVKLMERARRPEYSLGGPISFFACLRSLGYALFNSLASASSWLDPDTALTSAFLPVEDGPV